MVPGQTQFTLILNGPTSFAIACVIRMTPGLRRAVGPEHREARLAGLRGDADDAPAPTLLDHLLGGRAHAEEDAAQVDGNRPVEPLVRHHVQRRAQGCRCPRC